MNFIFTNGKITSELEYGEISISPNKDLGYRPFELFVSSLVGCSTPLLSNILTKRRVPFEKIKVNVSATRNPEMANRIEQITFTADVVTNEPMSELLSEKFSGLVIKNCGIIQSVIGSIDVTYQIVFSPIQVA